MLHERDELGDLGDDGPPHTQKAVSLPGDGLLSWRNIFSLGGNGELGGDAVEDRGQVGADAGDGGDDDSGDQSGHKPVFNRSGAFFVSDESGDGG